MTSKSGILPPQQDPSAETNLPRKSIVLVRFPGYGKALAYYNDTFNIRPGDRVFVSGKLEGVQGRVEKVNYTFKIKVSEYQRILAAADTDVRGTLLFAGSHFAAFDPKALPREKVRGWFLPPAEEEYIVGEDGASFPLTDLSRMDIDSAVAARGHDYYCDNKVIYLELDGTHGYAIVQGTQPYEVDFAYQDGEVSGLVCSCWCNYACKHQFAAMLQLRETLGVLRENYADEYEENGYLAAMLKGTFFRFAVDGRQTGRFTLG